ncbi:MAG TPA: Cof-type HAD-IIB family hydrolase, partial [Acidaminococcaceae bacterium]|nr:Cof-type HAD-IIB family hydrolase [Acidaminococcaceae bacterium]
MAIKLIASDMDGTLLSSGIAISEKNKDAIRKAVDSGIVFLIATGRMYVSAQTYA